MHAAIAIGAILLGGWTLDSSIEEPTLTEPLKLPPATAPALPYRPNTMDRSRESQPPSRDPADQVRSRAMMEGMVPDRQLQGSSRASRFRGQSEMPLSPTEALAPGAGGALGQPTAPTAAVPSTTDRNQMSPVPPTRQPSASAVSGYNPPSYGTMQQAYRSQTPNLGNLGVSPITEKAFSGYRATSGVSPYMNLFRRNTGGADNYTTLVRPELEQRSLNQQVGLSIRGLERNTRMQGSAIQDLSRENRTLQGVGTPQFYMNYGNFYPTQNQGFGQ